MPPRISVIVPIYNAASTLRAAVQSILTQDIAGLEVLLVDDGSTDATPGLCHDLALRDDRIQVITQKNAGICAARNRGLSVAEGMYVTFCDDDDLLLPGALALLLQKAEDTGADIVRADYELIHIGPDGTETPQPHPAGTACDLAADGDYRKFLQNSGPQFVWNALYRRSAIGNLRFDEHCRYGLEDFIFNAGLYARTDKVHYLPQPVYRHFESGQSTSQCQTVQALQGQHQGVLDRWWAAEYKAIQARCPEAARAAVWNDRRAQAITFLMHQLADAKAPVRCAATAGALYAVCWPVTRPRRWIFGTKPSTIKSRPAHCCCTTCGCNACMNCGPTARKTAGGNCHENDSGYRRRRIYRPPRCQKCAGSRLQGHRV